MSIDVALCLPAPDVEALRTGKLITVLPKTFIHIGRQFALYPSLDLTDSPSLESRYQSSFLPTARNVVEQLNTERGSIKAWARCELCQILDDVDALLTLARSSVWKAETLENILLQQKRVFLAFLRVYELPNPLEVVHQPGGQFISLTQSINVECSNPILNDYLFEKRKQQLENLEPPEHPELEELYNAVTQSAEFGLAAQALGNDIKFRLGWSDQSAITTPDSDLSWISTIASFGNSSDGHTFEKLVRKSLIKLGFSNSRNDSKASLDPDATGGAGGIDFYCDAPYPVVGECKATKTEKVPSKTPGQLIHLGKNHLQNDYDPCIKLIVAAGELTIDAELTTVNNQMNLIRPETLQRLVELKAHHPGSIDLLDLKPHLENSPFGVEADDKVNRYIDKVWCQIRVRSHIIQLVKKFLETSQQDNADVAQLHAVYSYSNPPQSLKREEMHELLVELSSPLTGYLGRKKEGSGDRFYFLRDLVV